MTHLQKINEEINRELADEATVRALLATTFPGFDLKLMKQALLEGMMRGLPFQDFLKKRVYAIKYGDKYSLVTSIDYARAIGMRSGVVGVEAPVYEEKDGKLISCTVTVKRKVDEYIGSYTDTAYFDEYNTGRNLWAKMPKRMIAKVAEMAALRKACPEELEKVYEEEEMAQASVIEGLTVETQKEIADLKSLEELNTYYQANKGKGKAFDKAIMERKRDLEAQNNEEAK